MPPSSGMLYGMIENDTGLARPCAAAHARLSGCCVCVEPNERQRSAGVAQCGTLGGANGKPDAGRGGGEWTEGGKFPYPAAGGYFTIAVAE